MQYVVDIAINLIANLIGWLIVLSIGLYAVLVRARERRRLLEFLGLNRDRAKVMVYLSSLDLNIEIGNLYNQKQSWKGTALSAAEFEIIPRVDRWLQPILTGQVSFLDLLIDYVTPKNMRLPKVSVEYMPSPRNKEELQLVNRTSIIIGGCAHNYGAKVYTDEERMVMETVDPEKAVRVIQGMYAGRLIKPSSHLSDNKAQETEVAKVEKIYDRERDSIVFFAEGVDTNGTLGAVYFLILNWERLASRYKQEPFAICIECPTRSKDRYGYLKPLALFEIPNNSQKSQTS